MDSFYWVEFVDNMLETPGFLTIDFDKLKVLNFTINITKVKAIILYSIFISDYSWIPVFLKSSAKELISFLVLGE